MGVHNNNDRSGFVILYWSQRSYYLRKKNRTITFVVRFKNRTTHYIDLHENITRDELIWRVIRISGEEETFCKEK